MPRRIPRQSFGCHGCLGYMTWHRNHGPTAKPRWVCEGCGRVHDEKVAQDPEQEKVLADAITLSRGNATRDRPSPAVARASATCPIAQPTPEEK